MEHAGRSQTRQPTAGQIRRAALAPQAPALDSTTDFTPRGVQMQDLSRLARNGPAAVAQRQRLRSLFGPAAGFPDGQEASASRGAPVAQLLMSVAAFKALTPWSVGNLRWSITAIDDALAAVYAAPAHAQVVPLQNLIAVATNYIMLKQAGGDGANVRIPHVFTLINEAYQEQAQAEIRTKVHRMLNAPNGAAVAVPGDFAGPPLSLLTLSELNQILAVGHLASAAHLAQLITATTSAVGAGSAAPRLIRVLQATPPPHTPVALAPVIAAKLEIDHKILRARLTTPLGPGLAPGAGHRDVIGGHGRRVLNKPETFAVSANAANANTTSAATFRKVARGDAAGTAAAAAAAAGGDVITAFQARALVGTAWINAPPAFNPGFAAAPMATQLAAQAQHAGAVAAGLVAIGQFNGHVLAAQAAAVALVANGDVNHATLIAVFIDAVEDARASATAILTATHTLLTTAGIAGVNAGNRQAVTAARQGVAADFLVFETAGPVMTNPKNSTLGPANMSEDDILALGNVVAALPATLFRDHATANAPLDGTLVSTKHQHIHQGILWIAMKDNVTYNNVPAITLTGGTLSSFYPTQHAAIPPDPVHPAVDADGYTGVH